MYKKIVTESELRTTLETINKRQAAKNIFLNVTVKPYKGQKHPNEKEKLYIVTIG